MRFFESGSGSAAVLFIHGVPSPSTDFLPIADALSATHRSLLVDLPGYRGEAEVAGPDAFGRTQRMLEEALLERGVQKLAVVAYSGAALRAYALAFSGRVQVTAIISLAGFAGLDAAEGEALRAAAALARAGQFPRSALPVRFLSPSFLSAHPERAREIERWMDLAAPSIVADDLDAFTRIDLRPRLRELTIPVYAIAGDVDQAVDPSHTRTLPEYLPGAEAEIVPGVGHGLLQECPQRVIDGIRRTLARAR